MRETRRELGICIDILSDFMDKEEYLIFHYYETIEKIKTNKNIFYFSKRKKEIMKNKGLIEQSKGKYQKYKELFYDFVLLKNYIDAIERTFLNTDTNNVILNKKDFIELKDTYQKYQKLSKKILDLKYSETLLQNVNRIEQAKLLKILKECYQILYTFSSKREMYFIEISPCEEENNYNSLKEIWVDSIKKEKSYIEYVAMTSTLNLKKARERKEGKR